MPSLPNPFIVPTLKAHLRERLFRVRELGERFINEPTQLTEAELNLGLAELKQAAHAWNRTSSTEPCECERCLGVPVRR